MNNRRTSWFLAALLFAGLVAASVATAQKNDQAEVLLQAAFHKQLVDGELEEAIQLYKSIIANHASNRAVAAKALVQMGQCYEKLGKTEARKAYELVLRDYADQREQVTIARARLAALTPASPATAFGLVTRQIWAGPEVDIFGGPSPDGRYLSFVDWTTGDLAIRDLETRQKRRLTNKGSWDESQAYAEHSTPSPDGKQVAYTWLNKDLSHDLRVIGLDGSEPRVLYRNEEVSHMEPAGWSPDGKRVLTLFSRTDNTYQIVLVSVSDGSVRVLKTLDWRRPWKMSISPDGDYLVYDFPPKEDAPERDIVLLATDGSREIPLVDHPADDLFPVWTPDGKRIVFASDRTGSLSVWMIGVADGKPLGPPELVKHDMGQRVVPMGFTRKGSYYYGLVGEMADIYMATLDLATGKLLAPPTQVTRRIEGSNTSPAWSPDGKHLAYFTYRALVPGLDGSGTKILSIRSLETGEERKLSPDLHVSALLWSPDGHSFLVAGSDKEGRQGVYEIDAQTGDFTLIVESESGESIVQPKLSPDAETLFYVRRDPSTKSFRILARNLDTGQEKDLYGALTPSSFFRYMALSPDGQQLAFVTTDFAAKSHILMVVPTGGGETRELLREDFNYAAGLAWTPDGREIIFGTGGQATDLQELTVELWRISAQGGEPQALELAMDNLRHMRVHPDGKRIAFTAGQRKFEVWVMENFLPELEAAN
ncbi:MAG: hypothetical protein ABFS02_00520 [Pseudomonadota bacterium]